MPDLVDDPDDAPAVDHVDGILNYDDNGDEQNFELMIADEAESAVECGTAF